MRAYTLFEVLIVLGLLSVVLLFVSMAIHTHVRQTDINRTGVEEAQLARVLLETIAKDIRNVIVPLREETLEVDSEALGTVIGLNSANSTAANGTKEDSAASFDVGLTDTAAATESVLYGIYGTVPGIYGDLDWIQIDTARLPRGEMFGSRQIRRGTSSASDRLSSAKTVLYYLGSDTGQLTVDDPRYQPEQLTGSIGRPLDPNAAQYGLFRRQLDRQVIQYAIQEGIESENEQFDEPFAPEVELIEFSYFDPELSQAGTTGDWVDVWDMEDRQMLPSAVRISVGIRRPATGESISEPVIYSLIVPVPVPPEISTEESVSAESAELTP